MEHFTNKEMYHTAVLGPLYNGGEIKKEDIMRKSEDNYLNPSHKDCRLTIPSDPDKTSGRKKEEWAIQQAYEDEYIIRTERGMYKITDKGKAFVEDFSERLEHECIRLDEEAEKSTQAFAGGMTAEEFLGLTDSSGLEAPLGFSDDNLSDMFDDPDYPFELIRESDESLLSPSGIAILREIYKTNQVDIKARQAEEVMEKIKNQKP